MEIIFEEELRKAVNLTEDVVDVIEKGFSLLATGDVQTPPIMRIEVPENNGEVDVKAAKVQGLGQFAIKVSSGFFNNPTHGLPSSSGMMLLLSALTGYPEAILVDNGYLTDVRTAAAGAVCAKYLANTVVDTVGVIGSGNQARQQLRALALVRDFRVALVYSRNPEHARTFSNEMSQLLGKPVLVATSPEELVRSSDIVITATPSTQPVILSSWVHPGLHITAMGSDAEFKQELDPKIFSEADKVCCDLTAQSLRLGELHHAVDAGFLSRERIFELGDITSKKLLGRTHPQHVTVCDLTGTGVQDTMIAIYALEHVMANRVKVKESETDNFVRKEG